GRAGAGAALTRAGAAGGPPPHLRPHRPAVGAPVQERVPEDGHTVPARALKYGTYADVGGVRRAYGRSPQPRRPQCSCTPSAAATAGPPPMTSAKPPS